MSQMSQNFYECIDRKVQQFLKKIYTSQNSVDLWDIWDIWDIFILLFETFKKNKKGKKEKEELRIKESLK